MIDYNTLTNKLASIEQRAKRQLQHNAFEISTDAFKWYINEYSKQLNVSLFTISELVWYSQFIVNKYRRNNGINVVFDKNKENYNYNATYFGVDGVYDGITLKLIDTSHIYPNSRKYVLTYFNEWEFSFTGIPIDKSVSNFLNDRCISEKKFPICLEISSSLANLGLFDPARSMLVFDINISDEEKTVPYRMLYKMVDDTLPTTYYIHLTTVYSQLRKFCLNRVMINFESATVT